MLSSRLTTMQLFAACTTPRVLSEFTTAWYKGRDEEQLNCKRLKYWSAGLVETDEKQMIGSRNVTAVFIVM